MLTSSDDLRIGPLRLRGRLRWPSQPVGVVVFVHGNGSGRQSPRNRFVADVLQDHHLATLLCDLLTETEARDRSKALDIGLLATRLLDALDVLRLDGQIAQFPVGLFGASTGAAAALRLCAEHPGRVGAVVSRGGRTDLAEGCLARVLAPTLLIVGGRDDAVLQCNRDAMRRLRCNKRLETVPGAGHLFDEPGALDAVAHLAGDWFGNHLHDAGTR